MKKLTAIAATALMVLAMAAPAWADTVSAGGMVAGTGSDQVTVAGSASLATGPAPQLPFGSDLVVTGNPVPPSPFAQGVNVPFEINEGLAGVGPIQDDVVADSFFFGGDFATAGPGALSVEAEDTFTP